MSETWSSMVLQFGVLLGLNLRGMCHTAGVGQFGQTGAHWKGHELHFWEL